jgi:Asp-tRNA(Asn)/Glu-tRNA(Gln) amidotransferase A subunit family amidase
LQEVTQSSIAKRGLKDKSKKIFKYSQEEICKLVTDGSIEVEDVKLTYMVRALDVAVKNNYIAELYLSSVIKNKDGSNPFEGVTYSVADWINMDGYDSTCGFSTLVFKHSSQDSVIVKVLN